MNGKEILRNRVAPLAVFGSVMFAGCSSDSETQLNNEAPTSTEAMTEADQERAAIACPEGFTTETPIAEEFALARVGSESSVLPSYRTVEGDVTTLAEPSEVADSIMENTCDAPTLLAIFDATYLQTGGFNETGRYALPDETLLSTIQSRTELFRENSDVALNTLENLASVVLPEGGVVYVDDFNVIKGQAVLISPVRDEEGNAMNIETKDVPTEGLFEGYQLRFNLDDASLTEEQKMTLKSISELVLITPDGEIIINQWLGTGATNFEVTEEEPTVEIGPNGEEITVTTIVGENGEEIEVRTIPGPDGNPVVVTIAPNGTPIPVTPTPDTTGAPTPAEPTPTTGTTPAPVGTTPTTGTTPVTTTVVTSAPPSSSLPPITVVVTTAPPTTPPDTTLPPTPPTTAPPTPPTAPPTTVKGAEPPADCVNNPYDPRC